MKLGRDTLKECFKAGKLPTEGDFSLLIDSMLHMEDEGFAKTRLNGLEVTSALSSKSLVTFFQKEKAGIPLWTVQHASDGQLLNLHPVLEKADARTGAKTEMQMPALTLDNRGRVGIGLNGVAPQQALHVGDFIASKGRTGTYPLPAAEKPMRPDHEWHLLAENLSGCVAFEVVACASSGSGASRHQAAVMHAYALNAHNPTVWGGWNFLDRVFNRKKRIRCHNAWSTERCDRMELAWLPWKEPNAQDATPGTGKNAAKTDRYALAIRTQCKYSGSDARLEVRVTQLWPVPEDPPTA